MLNKFAIKSSFVLYLNTAGNYIWKANFFINQKYFRVLADNRINTSELVYQFKIRKCMCYKTHIVLN